jgi:enamine deaminase RidA (YjgF/YER057c/UK114 family)
MIERTIAPGLSQPPGYSHVVVASGRRLVTTAGAVPLDAEGNLVGAGDRQAQARQTLENLASALEAVGATAQDVIKITVYVVAGERADLGSVWVALQQLGIAGAASTLLGVSMLAVEGNWWRSRPSPCLSSGARVIAMLSQNFGELRFYVVR